MMSLFKNNILFSLLAFINDASNSSDEYRPFMKPVFFTTFIKDQY